MFGTPTWNITGRRNMLEEEYLGEYARGDTWKNI